MIDDQGRRFYALVIGAAAYLFFVVGFVRRMILSIVQSLGGELLTGNPLGWLLLNGAVTVACAYPLARFVLAQDRARASRVMIAAIVPITLVSFVNLVLRGASSFGFAGGALLHITLSAVIPWAMVQGLQRREQDMLALAGADADAATDTEPSNTASDTNAGKYVTIVWLLLSQALFAAAWVAVMALSEFDSGNRDTWEAVATVILLGLLGTIGWSWTERQRGRYLLASLISAGAFLVLPLAGYVAFRLYD